ncbi:SRPBCC family protein [Pseudalkalibacillus berkeleyi]|uniref:SRPBCC family protein n=1 Tax=Pseudalkalibacillus berkeleyi TaxID=1069813 RepID=A0ABS9H218_9BACL|nr:SRPBCC family protein [Pseudalkalibacillus berkeleyi]MCF6139024.1 SRPBCC family protein [Pseudalkalibacillus berkeleyi]
MIKINVSNTIHAPHDRVFSYISNFENNPKWQGGMVSARFTSEGPIGVGSTYEQVAKFLGKEITTTFKVVEYEENRKIKIESIKSTFPITVTRTVEPHKEGTLVSAIVEGDASKTFKVAQPLMKLMVKKSVKSDYKNLKKQLESA